MLVDHSISFSVKSNMNHENLRRLQASFNASIDEYIDVPPDAASQKGRIALLQESIRNQVAMVQAEIVPPISQILQMFWGVSEIDSYTYDMGIPC